MTDAFELERSKQRNAQYQKTLAPHQQHESNEIRERKIQERASKIENAPVAEPKQQEEMYEDPF